MINCAILMFDTLFVNYFIFNIKLKEYHYIITSALTVIILYLKKIRLEFQPAFAVSII